MNTPSREELLEIHRNFLRQWTQSETDNRPSNEVIGEACDALYQLGRKDADEDSKDLSQHCANRLATFLVALKSIAAQSPNVGATGDFLLGQISAQDECRRIARAALKGEAQP